MIITRVIPAWCCWSAIWWVPGCRLKMTAARRYYYALVIERDDDYATRLSIYDTPLLLPPLSPLCHYFTIRYAMPIYAALLSWCYYWWCWQRWMPLRTAAAVPPVYYIDAAITLLRCWRYYRLLDIARYVLRYCYTPICRDDDERGYMRHIAADVIMLRCRRFTPVFHYASCHASQRQLNTATAVVLRRCHHFLPVTLFHYAIDYRRHYLLRHALPSSSPSFSRHFIFISLRSTATGRGELSYFIITKTYAIVYAYCLRHVATIFSSRHDIISLLLLRHYHYARLYIRCHEITPLRHYAH